MLGRRRPDIRLEKRSRQFWSLVVFALTWLLDQSSLQHLSLPRTGAGFSPTHRTNSFDGPSSIYFEQPLMLMDSFENKTILRARTMHNPPITFVSSDSNGNPVFSGALVFVFVEIMRELNIKYSLENQKDGIFGSKRRNGEWTGSIGAIVKNETDVLVGPLVMTPTRNEVVQYSVSLVHSNMAVLGSTPRPTTTDVAGLAMVFHPQVWLAMLVSLLILVVVSSVEVEIRETNPRLKILPLNKFYENVFCYVSVLFLKGTPREPTNRHLSSRLLLGIWWLAILVLANAFCGHFRARMMIKQEEEKLRDLDHLAQISHRITPVIWKGTAFEEFFRSKQRTEVVAIWKALKASGGSKLRKDLFSTETLLRMSSGKLVILNEEITTKYVVSTRCFDLGLHNVYFADERFFFFIGGFAFRKGMDTRLVKEINKRIRWMNEGFIPQKMMDNESQGFDRCMSGFDSRTEGIPLSLKDLGGIFLLELTFLTFSVFAFVVENGHRFSKTLFHLRQLF